MGFFVAMILFPEAQAKAQQEIDLVTGSNRLPTIDDRSRLPYVGRLINELFRWRPTVPNGIPHVSSKDDIYKGYYIPRGAIVFWNVWAMSRNSDVYHDPEMFEPDRFLNPSVPVPPTFGYGRRACPGIHYAESFLFICITSILATFEIGMAEDELGDKVAPPLKSRANTFIFHPAPFRFKITPRSLQYEHLVQAGA
ncbi:cytochrome P450 family protein [Ceratobasidium sp. AG-Ba]|nr:cytochrome P450 family protein [Ceratobasidium sp. AG-Ba]